MVVYLSALCGIFSILFALRVYVAFRAPIGIGRCNIDRFLLSRAWLPALNVVLIAFVSGIVIPIIKDGDYSATFFLVVLVILTVPLTKIFVQAFAALPAWNSKYNLPFGYGNGNFNRYCSLLLPVKQHRTVFYV